MKTSVYKPSGPLESFVEQYWIMESGKAPNGAPTLVYPLGKPEMMFHFGEPFITLDGGELPSVQPRSLLCAQKLSAINVRALGRVGVFAITFKPYGAAAFCGFDISKHINRNINLCDIYGDSANSVVEMLGNANDNANRVVIVEEFLKSKLRSKLWEFDIIKRGIEAIDKDYLRIRIDEAAQKACVSYRQFDRLFQSRIGLTPKQYLKIKRINFAIGLMSSRESVSLTEIGLKTGFYDQSHFIASFKSIMNVAPSKILSLIRNF